MVKLNLKGLVPLTGKRANWWTQHVATGGISTLNRTTTPQLTLKRKQNTDTQLRLARAHQRHRLQNSESYVQEETLHILSKVFSAFEAVFFFFFF